jgi:hypothetical protein
MVGHKNFQMFVILGGFIPVYVCLDEEIGLIKELLNNLF